MSENFTSSYEDYAFEKYNLKYKIGVFNFQKLTKMNHLWVRIKVSCFVLKKLT